MNYLLLFTFHLIFTMFLKLIILFSVKVCHVCHSFFHGVTNLKVQSWSRPCRCLLGSCSFSKRQKHFQGLLALQGNQLILKSGIQHSLLADYLFPNVQILNPQTPGPNLLSSIFIMQHILQKEYSKYLICYSFNV